MYTSAFLVKPVKAESSSLDIVVAETKPVRCTDFIPDLSLAQPLGEADRWYQRRSVNFVDFLDERNAGVRGRLKGGFVQPASRLR